MLHARQDYQDRIIDTAGKIPADEPVMLFRAQDQFFVQVLRYYRDLLCVDGQVQPELIAAVEDHINRALHWAEAHPTKRPDLPVND